MKIHFLNVWHWDCTIIEFESNRFTMIDINNWTSIDEETIKELFQEFKWNELEYLVKKSSFWDDYNYNKYFAEKWYNISLTNPIEWLNKEWIKSVFRFISTHPDMDHISGLHQLKKDFPIYNFWVVKNNCIKSKEELDASKYSYDDWTAYKNLKASISNPICIWNKRWAECDYYKQDWVYILSPDDELVKLSNDKWEYNHLSYVLLVKYGNYKIYLCWDATADETIPNMLEHYWEGFFKKQDWEIIILKAPHHWRDSWYHQKFVSLLNPDYTIVSVWKKPSTDASNKYRNYSDNVWSTRYKWNITIDFAKNEYFHQYNQD